MSIKIGLGVSGIPFSGPSAFLEWVDYCESSSVDSLWFSDRVISRSLALEPLVAMAVVAGRTRRLKFGMNAIVLPFRDPVVLAKECATLDYLSGGRLLPVFGVGGETSPEWAAMGVSPAGRGTKSDEMLQIMAGLWAEESVTFEGKYFTITDASISPRPVQQPLPLWIGGSSPAAIRRTARYGTGWLSGVQTPAQVAPVVAKIRKAAAEEGRPIDEDHYGAGFQFRFGSPDDEVVQRSMAALARLRPEADVKGIMAVGSARDIAARAREFTETGVSKFVMRPIAADDGDTMEQTRRLVEEVIPEVQGWPAPDMAAAAMRT